MLKDKALSMLGLARKAGRLSMGHDAAKQSVLNGKAKQLIFCSDASPRLVKEFKNLIEVQGIDLLALETQLTMDEIHFFVGGRVGVMTVDDENFSRRINILLTQEENANGDKG